MASTVKGEPATWAPSSVMATVCRPTSLHGTATLYAPPPSASDAAIARPQPLGPGTRQQQGKSVSRIQSAGDAAIARPQPLGPGEAAVALSQHDPASAQVPATPRSPACSRWALTWMISFNQST